MPIAQTGLRRRVLRAGMFSIFAFGSGQLLRLATNLVVSRLVTPGEFGLMALATAILVVLTLISDIGLRQCIVRSPNGDSPQMLHSAWTLQVIRGGLIFTICCLIGLCIGSLVPLAGVATASVYSHPELPYVISTLGLTSLILGFNTARSHTAQRRLDLKRPALVEVGSQIATVVVTLALAYHNRTVWAFVGGAIAGALTQVALNGILMPGPRDRFMLDRDSVHELIGFGRWILLSSTVFVLASNGDRLLLGHWISASALGLYSIAVALASLPEMVVGRLLNSVALPALSEVYRNHPGRLTEVYYRFRLPLDIVLFGLSGLLLAVGPGLIELMYDPRYLSAGPLLQILSISAIFARHGLDGCLYMACGRPQHLSTLHLVKLVSMFVLLPVGFFLADLSGAVLGVSLVALPTLPLIYWINSRMGVLDWWREARAVPAWPAGFLVGQLLLSLN